MKHVVTPKKRRHVSFRLPDRSRDSALLWWTSGDHRAALRELLTYERHEAPTRISGFKG